MDLIARLVLKVISVSILAGVWCLVVALFQGNPPTWVGFQTSFWVIFVLDILWALVKVSGATRSIWDE